MLRHLVLLIVAVLPAAPLPEVGDMGKIQGKWRLLRGQTDPSMSVEFPPMIKEFKGDQMLVDEIGHKKFQGPFRLDPNRNPKQISYTLQIDKRMVIRYGIYELDGDRLRICFTAVTPQREKDRPADFTTPESGGRVLLEFERVKR